MSIKTGTELPRSPKPPAHLEPVDAGHEDVEDRRVDAATRLEPLERFLAVAGELDVVALELERAPSDSRTARSSSTTRIFIAALCVLRVSARASLSDFLAPSQPVTHPPL